MLIGLIDYGAGNFASVWNAFHAHGHPLCSVTTANDLRRCSHVVLPGVGAFSTAMERLSGMNLVEPLRVLLADGRTPFLGICVGMQILASRGVEFVPTEGLGTIPGEVLRLDDPPRAGGVQLPHIGWNDVRTPPDSILFHGIDPEDPTFYFVHSYSLRSTERTTSFSYSDHGGEFIAAVEHGRVFGVQFHPEKSQRNGKLLITNFLSVPNA
jgi:glutamine amidotransferase